METNQNNDIYIARQPIFDRKREIYGYELLYRQGGLNTYTGTDDDVSTAGLLSNSFMVIGFDTLIEGTRGFINFPEDLLLHEVPMILPKERVVIEILERVVPNDSLISVCERLKANGYTIALDDFVYQPDCAQCESLIELADIIKVEYGATAIEQQKYLIDRYGGNTVFLAEKVEDESDYRQALEIGYGLFQGYFFSKPVMLNATDIGVLDARYVLILDKCKNDDPDFDAIARIIQADLGLSYKLLKVINSVYFGASRPVRTIRRALIYMGARELTRWIHVMMLSGIKRTQNAELVKTCMIRGQLLSLLAVQLGCDEELQSDFFIAGILSSIDRLLNQNMETILTGLPISGRVRRALLDRDNLIGSSLDAVIAHESANWRPLDRLLGKYGISRNRFMLLYLDALKWYRATLV